MAKTVQTGGDHRKGALQIIGCLVLIWNAKDKNNKKKRRGMMKVKIKGLVFVGFAAAVFAQSAMATPSEPARRVASQKYVDDNRVKIGTNGGVNEYTSVDASGVPWTSNTDYPSMKVLGDVKSALELQSSIGATDYTTKVEVKDNGNNVIGHNIILNASRITTTGANLAAATGDTTKL